MSTAPGLLGSNEPAPFEVVNESGQGNLVLVCDHASNRIPKGLNQLGLTEDHLASHIGWDIGAAEVARLLSARLDAPLVLSAYSRLVIDCNRWPHDPQSIPEHSGGISIPGNSVLSKDAILSRRQYLFDPYQAQINALLEKSATQPKFLLSIHSFTPSLFGADRPWPIGVCYRRDVELGRNWIDALQARVKGKSHDELVGDNEPYEIEEDIDYTLVVQGENRSIPSIMLEIRQDRVLDQAGVRQWSDIIADAWLSMDSGYLVSG